MTTPRTVRRETAARRVPWKWVEGLCVPWGMADLAGFARVVLADPRDSLARLALADRLDEFGRVAERAAEGLRRSGEWHVSGASNRRFLGLSWWPRPAERGLVICNVRLDLCPACGRCGYRPKARVTTAVLWGGADYGDGPTGWECFTCRWKDTHRNLHSRTS